MYLRDVLQTIEAGGYKDPNIEHLPTGLQGYYEDYWRLMDMKVKP
jgi:hypothetical protein